MKRLPPLSAAFLLAGLSTVCLGQDSSPPAAEPKDPNVLRGPKVEEEAKARTLVSRDYQGKLVRLEVDPAQAALDLIELDPKDREAAHKIILERDALIDKLVFDNLKTIAELAQARQAGDAETTSRLIKDLWDKSAPWRERGRLADELARVLPDDKARQLKSLVDEYVRAAVEDRRAQPGKDGKAPGALGAVLAEGLEGFGREIKRSYERVFLSQAKDFDALIAKLQLTPEQESKVRQLVGDLFQKTYGKPTKAQSSKVFLQVYALLDPEQRRMLAEQIGRDRRDELRHPAGKAAEPEQVPESPAK